MNRSKTKGTSHESAIVAYLNELGFTEVERRALQGAVDKGDIAGLRGVVIEAKNVAVYNLPGWLRETQVETENAGAWLGVCWAKLKGVRDPSRCAVIMTGEQFGFLLLALRKAGIL